MEIRFEQNLISIPIINYKLPLPTTIEPVLLQLCPAGLQGGGTEREVRGIISGWSLKARALTL
jgi:hypothetical protein